jgi:hypothetical protein
MVAKDHWLAGREEQANELLMAAIAEISGQAGDEEETKPGAEKKREKVPTSPTIGHGEDPETLSNATHLRGAA